jgi:mannitol 2-dehydrogenase
MPTTGDGQKKRLSQANLTLLPSTVSVPTYDRSAVTPGILHIGLGNFHRAHEAVYVDDLFNKGLSLDWGIVGAGVSKRTTQRRNGLEPQDWLTVVVARDGDTVTPRVCGSMVDFVPDAADYGPLKAKLLDPAIRIVSMTLTEGGYFLSPSTGKFDPTNPKIVEDGKNPDSPKTFFGLVVQALKKRREAGVSPFTVLSCDNVPHNGDATKDVVVGLAALHDEDLADWIRENVGFPNGMVDRIVPSTTDKERKFVRDNYGVDDFWPVFCEPFAQWILEDNFPSGRPALEKVGVEFVPDVSPYEIMKIRILNGGHASLCYPAALLGVQTVDGAMTHPTIGPFLDALERTELIPSVPPVPNTDLEEYWKLIAKRFSNPTIEDQIERNCKDGSDRQPKFIIPPAADNLKAGRPIEGLALVSAMWCRYCQGKTETGAAIPPNDAAWDTLQATAKKAATTDDPAAWVGMAHIYGEVGTHPRFVEAFSSALREISENGVEAAMKKYTEKNKQQ